MKKVIFLFIAVLSVWFTAQAEEAKVTKPLVNPKKPKVALPVKAVLPAKAVSPVAPAVSVKPAQSAKPSIPAKAALKADVAKPATLLAK